MSINAHIQKLAERQISFEGIDCFNEIAPLLENDWQNQRLLHFLLMNSEVCRILRKNFADWELLEIAYYGKAVRLVELTDIDIWLMKSQSGQALRDRLYVVSNWMKELVNRAVDDFKILDFGAGPGPHALKAINSDDKLSVTWDCVDIDNLALDFGKIRAAEAKIDHIVNFRRVDIFSKNGQPTNKVDFGLIIGILCGMTPDQACNFLKSIQPLLKNSGEILAATLLDNSFEEDPRSFRIFCNILGWPLKPKSKQEILTIFEQAGYRIIDCFSERGNNEGQYAIVHAKVN